MAGTVVINDQLRQLSSFYGLDPATVLTLLHSRDRAPRHGSALPDQSAAMLTALVTLQHRLDDMFTTHAGAEGWLHGPSGYFGGELPIDHLAAGEIDRVNAALDAIEAGVFV